jgi:hypothetical protein
VPLGAKARRLLWLLFEVAVGAIVVAGCYYWATAKPNAEFPMKWMAFVICTAVLFGYQAYWARADRKTLNFWGWWLLFLALHVVLIGAFVQRVSNPPLVMFVILTLGEAALITPIFAKMTTARTATKERTKGTV